MTNAGGAKFGYTTSDATADTSQAHAALCGIQSGDAAHEHHYHPTQAKIHYQDLRTAIWAPKFPCERKKRIGSATAAEGQTYAAETPDGFRRQQRRGRSPCANAQVVIRSSTKWKPLSWHLRPCADLQSISVGGKQYLVSTTDLQQKGKQGFGANKRTAEFTGGGAALGAIIGAIAGGGKARRSSRSRAGAGA